MILTAPPYSLRPMEDNDIDWVFRGLSDPKVYRYYGVRYHSKEATEGQMAWYKELQNNASGLWFAILNADNTPLGGIGLNDYEKEHRKAELGYWLLHEHWGKGIMKTVMPSVLDFGFSQWKLHRIEAIVEIGNEASSGLLKAHGFQYEGTERDCEFKDGQFVSHELYSLLETEYHSE